MCLQRLTGSNKHRHRGKESVGGIKTRPERVCSGGQDHQPVEAHESSAAHGLVPSRIRAPTSVRVHAKWELGFPSLQARSSAEMGSQIQSCTRASISSAVSARGAGAIRGAQRYKAQQHHVGFQLQCQARRLARVVDHDKDMHSTNFAGTIGYMAPEYLATGRATKETDVYSFGVVLLEITCGRRPVDHEFFNNQVVSVEWVWNIYGSGQLLDAADPKLDSSEYDARKIERLMVVGLWCVHPDSSLRPSMRQVVQVLNSEAPLPSLPLAMPKAVFYYSNASQVATTTSSSTTYSGGGASSAGSTSDLLPK